MLVRANGNPTKAMQTARPDKYPQGSFKAKACRCCKTEFQPSAPSELYCSDLCKDKGNTNAYLKRVYGITYRQYHAMLAEQSGLCKICNGPGFLMKDCHKLLLVVDHCHKGGQVRGLLCHNCNRALGLLKDDPAIINRAAEYINNHLL